MFGEPDRVGALAGADVQRPTWRETGDLVHEGAVRVAAPHPFAAVPVVPVGRVRGSGRRGPSVFVREAEADHGAGTAAVCCGLQDLLGRIGDVARCVQPWDGGPPALSVTI